MSEKKVDLGDVALAVFIIGAVLVCSVIVVLTNYEGIISDRDSQIKTLTEKNAQLQSWLSGNVSALTALKSITNNATVTNWPTQQPEPSWRVVFYKGFQISWPQINWFVSTPDWEPYAGGYSEAIIYMRLTSMSASLSGISTTFFINYIQWYGSQGYNDFIGSTTLSEKNLSITMPGSVDPQNGPLEVETKAPYFGFQFAVDTTYNGSAWATFDMSVYFRN